MAQYWDSNRNPRLSNNPSGIKILEPGDDGFSLDEMDNFANDVAAALDLIYRTASGMTLLNTLAHAANDSVVISPGANMCGGCGHDARKAVAAELLASNAAVPGPATTNAVQTLFGYAPENALAQAINDCPTFTIEGLPGRYPGWFTGARLALDRLFLWSSDKSDGHFNDQLWINAPGYKSKTDAVISVDQIRNWLNGANIDNAEARQHAVLSTIVLTYNVSPNGNGMASWVTWDAGDPTYWLNQKRPPAVALAHELFHAYFNRLGMQPGVESGHFSTVLFEYRCVGLGPWDEANPSENSVRREWRDAVVPHTVNTSLDHRICPKRITYD